MKVTKAQLKGLLKEVVKELLDEGAFNKTIKEVLVEEVQAETGQEIPARASVMDVMREALGSNSQSQQPQQHLQESARHTSSSSKPGNGMGHSSPNERIRATVLREAQIAAGVNASGPEVQMMAEIFNDTMNTTVRSQRHDHEAKGAGLSNLMGPDEASPQERAKDDADLAQLSQGQGFGRWALAAGIKKK